MVCSGCNTHSGRHIPHPSTPQQQPFFHLRDCCEKSACSVFVDVWPWERVWETLWYSWRKKKKNIWQFCWLQRPPTPTVVNNWESNPLHPSSNLLIYAVPFQVFDTEKETSKQMLANRNDRPAKDQHTNTNKKKNCSLWLIYESCLGFFFVFFSLFCFCTEVILLLFRWINNITSVSRKKKKVTF